MSQAMQNEIDELRGRVFALETIVKGIGEAMDATADALKHLEQVVPIVNFLTPEVMAEMQELFHQEPKKGKRG